MLIQDSGHLHDPPGTRVPRDGARHRAVNGHEEMLLSLQSFWRFRRMRVMQAKLSLPVFFELVARRELTGPYALGDAGP